MTRLQYFTYLRSVYRHSMSSSAARRKAFAEATRPTPF
jgi:hypothetical protein